MWTAVEMACVCKMISNFLIIFVILPGVQDGMSYYEAIVCEYPQRNPAIYFIFAFSRKMLSVSRW